MSKKKKKPKHARHAASSNPSSSGAVSAEGKILSQEEEGAQPPAEEIEIAPEMTPTAPQPTFTAQPVGTVAIEGGVAASVPVAPMLPIDIKGAASKNRRKTSKILVRIFVVILAILAVVYVSGAVVFMDYFMPKTTVGVLDFSLKSSAEAQEMLAESLDDYTLAVKGEGFALTLSAHEAGVKIDGKRVTDAIHADSNEWIWPLELLKTHDETEKLSTTYNASGLGDKVRIAVDEFNKNATPPTNAVVAYDTAKKAFAVKPETMGTSLDYAAVLAAIDKAMSSMDEATTLTKNELAQPSVFSNNVDLKTAANSANAMIKADLTLTMAGSKAAQVNADIVSQWIVFGDDAKVSLNEEALTAWVSKLASDCSTAGTKRTYTRPDGKALSVDGGNYGWTVDEEALLSLVRENVTGGATATVAVPCSTEAGAFMAPGMRDWGNRFLDIDLDEQYVRFYDAAGVLVWESACISGIPDGQHDTSTGVYWLNEKASPSKLIGYNDGKKIYETTVQYWMPFVGNVIGLHDANWQPSFGGTMYADGYGSHGCVNLPPSKAAELYDLLETGDTVVCHW